MTTVLVTGAAGFIGRHLCRRLAASGRTVVGLGHGTWSEQDLAESGVRAWRSDDVAGRCLDDLADRYGLPEHVFHLAGGSSVGASLLDPLGDYLRTVASTAELLDWLRRKAPTTPVTAVSSAAVYGASHAGPIGEGAALRPRSPYGHHKLMMETLLRSYAKSYGSPSVIVRLFSVYGSGLQKQLLWELCSRVAHGVGRMDLQGTGDETRDWIEVRDTVRAIELASGLAGPEVPVINVGTGTGTPVREIAHLTLSAWGGASALAPLSFSGRGRDGDPFSLQADVSRLNALGFACEVPLSRGIDDYVRWFRAQSSRAP